MRRAACLMLAMLLSQGCSDSPTAPGEGSTAPAGTTTTRSFEATIAPRGSSFYSFTAATAGTVSVTLASVLASGSRLPSSAVVRMGVGIPAGEGCTTAETIETVASLTAQLAVTVPAGIHCIRADDPGTFTGPVLVSVRFTHP